MRLPTTRFKTLSLSFGRKEESRTRKVRLWKILTGIPSATWKSMSRVLRVDQSIKDKPITFAVKAAKMSLIKTRSSMQTRELKEPADRRNARYSSLITKVVFGQTKYNDRNAFLSVSRLRDTPTVSWTRCGVFTTRLLALPVPTLGTKCGRSRFVVCRFDDAELSVKPNRDGGKSDCYQRRANEFHRTSL